MTDPLNTNRYFNGEAKPVEMPQYSGPFDPPLTPTATREEYQDLLDHTKNGWVARSRKALAAGAVSLSGALAIGIPTIFGDGVVTWDETVPLLIASAGIGLAAAFATWHTPNAELYRG